MNSPLQRQWKVAMQQEYASLLENHTFTLVEYARSKPIGGKWVYKTKMNPDGTLRYKARLVIKGYEQMQGIGFDETYAPVSKMTTLRYLMSRAALEDWVMDQLDVVTAFLNPAIDKEVYMQLPEGIEWLIAEPLSSPSSSSSPADTTHKSTHILCAKAHSVSRAEERFVESTRTSDGNSRMSTALSNSRMSMAPGNSRVNTAPSNSLRVNMALGNSHMSAAPGNSHMSTAFDSQCMSTAPGNSQLCEYGARQLTYEYGARQLTCEYGARQLAAYEYGARQLT